MHSQTDQSDQYVENLSSLIDLSTIVILGFKQSSDLRRSHVAPSIIRYVELCKIKVLDKRIVLKIL